MKKAMYFALIIFAAAALSCAVFAGEIKEEPAVVEISDIYNNDVFEVLYTVKVDSDDVQKDVFDASRSSWSVESGKVSENFDVDWQKTYDWLPNDTTYLDGFRLVSSVSEGQKFVDIDGEPIKISKGYGFDKTLLNYVNYYTEEGYCTFSGKFYHYNCGYLLMADKMQNKTAYTAMYNVITNTFYHFPTVYTVEGRTDGPYERYHVSAFDNNGYALLYKTKVWPGGMLGNTVYDETAYKIKLKNKPVITVKYDGEKIAFDQIPVIENGRTLVPVRAIFEKIGAVVTWNEATRAVIAVKGDITVRLAIDDTTAEKNGEPIELDVPAKIINGRTMVPVRFVSDCFGVNVDWNDLERCVYLQTNV